MTKFMDVHSGFTGVRGAAHGGTRAMWRSRARKGSASTARGWTPSPARFCLSSGPSKEAVMRIHERAGHPTSEVYELAVEVS